jgi:hypothetical protein
VPTKIVLIYREKNIEIPWAGQDSNPGSLDRIYSLVDILQIILEYLMNKMSSQTPKNYNKKYYLVWARK